MAKPVKITQALIRHLNKQMKKSLEQFAEVSYGNGLYDAREICLNEIRKTIGKPTGREPEMTAWNNQSAYDMIERIQRALPERRDG